jgi:hypothetical protein
MGALRAAVRPLRASLVVVVLIASAVALSAAPAGASASGVFVACGYGGAVDLPVSVGSGCMSLPDAVIAAEASGNAGTNATIEMMPGTYCPIDIPSAFDNLTFEGIGISGADTSGGPVSISGPEAAISTFKYDDAHCGGSAPAYMVQASTGYYFDARINFENLAIDGTSGPSSGMHFVNVTLNLRDVLIENESTAGLYYQSGEDTDMQANNSAFIDNAVGAEIFGEAAIDESTMADNTVDGLLATNVDLHLDNDTIAHNATGLANGNSGDTIQMANTMVGANTQDCGGVALGIGGDLEPGGAAGGNGRNLIGATCNSGNTSGNDADIALTDSVTDINDNGGPTPSIFPPNQAQGTAEPGYCGSTGTDQREFLHSAGASCDIGAVDSSDSGTVVPTGSPDSLDLGTTPTNEPTSSAVTVYNSGGNIMGISAVSISGTGYTILNENCTYAVLLHQLSTSCFVGIQAAPSSQGEVDGTLKVSTTGGELDIPLTVTGGPPVTAPGAPTAVHGTASNNRVTLSWTAPADDGGQAIDTYAVRYSSNSGSSWTDGPTTSNTSVPVTGLTNGTAYLFEVAADNDFATGIYSDPSASLTPHTASDPSALTSPATTTIKYGDSTTLSTTLTDSTTHADLANANLVLMARAAGAASFSPAGTAVTTSSGIAKATVHPNVNTHYEWSFAGTSGHSARVSPQGTVSVAQVVHAALSSAQVRHGRIDKVYGTVSPNESGKVVTLQRLVSGTWRSTRITARITLQKLPNHKKVIGYVLTYQPRAKGKQTLRVIRTATSSNAAGASPRLRVTVT